jgi:hypothetical protein
MTVSPSIPATVELRRSRLMVLVAAVAVVAAGSAWAITNAAENTSSPSASSYTSAGLVAQAGQYGRGVTNIGVVGTSAGNDYANRIAKLTRLQQAAAFGGPGAVLDALGLTAKEKQYVQGVASMTPVQQAAAFGGPGGVLDALGLTAKEKRYVQGITSLTQVQQAAAFGR